MDLVQLLYQLYASLELGLIYGLVAIGVYISFRVLDFPDLTVDGSFTLGAAVAGVLILLGVSPWIASLLSMFAGALAGLVTAWLNVRWNILHLLASILTMMALYSVNLRVMGGPHLPLHNEATVFSPLINIFGTHLNGVIVLLFLVVPIVVTLVYRFLSSEVGLGLRATGKNTRMARAQGVRTDNMVLLGVAVSNSLVALAGAFFAQAEGFASTDMGQGTILMGLAAVIIGELVPARSLFIILVTCVMGSIIYRFMFTLAINAEWIRASDLNLLTAVLIASAMVLSSRIRGMFVNVWRSS